MNRTQRRANERATGKQNKALKNRNTINRISKIGTAVVLTSGFLAVSTAGGLPANLATISHSAFMATSVDQNVVKNPTIDNFKLFTEADGSLSIVSTILKNEGQDNPIESMVRSHNLVVDFAPLELALAKVKAESAAQLIVRDEMAGEVYNSTNFLTSETNGVYTFTLNDGTISPFTTLEEFTAWQESVQALADAENAKLVALRFKVQEAQDALNDATMPKADPSHYGLSLTSYDSPFASQAWMMGSEALKAVGCLVD